MWIIHRRYYNVYVPTTMPSHKKQPSEETGNNTNGGANRKSESAGGVKTDNAAGSDRLGSADDGGVLTGGSWMDGPVTDATLEYVRMGAAERLRVMAAEMNLVPRGEVESLVTRTADTDDASSPGDGSGEEDRGEPKPGKYEPVELHSDMKGYLKRATKESEVVANESEAANLYLTAAMESLAQAKTALQAAREGAIETARAASSEIKRRDYLSINVGEEVNKMFMRHALQVEGRGGPPSKVDAATNSLLNEIGKLRYEVIAGAARERTLERQMKLRNAQVHEWAVEYKTAAKELMYQIQRGDKACGGFWPEQMPHLEIKGAIMGMNLAMEVLSFITRPDATAIYEGEPGAWSGMSGEACGSADAREREGPKSPPWKPPTAGGGGVGARGRGRPGSHQQQGQTVKWLGTMKKEEKTEEPEDEDTLGSSID